MNEMVTARRAAIDDLTPSAIESRVVDARRRRAETVTATIWALPGAVGSRPLPDPRTLALAALALVFTLAIGTLASGFGPTASLLLASGITSIAGFAFSPVAQVFLSPFQIEPVRLLQTLLICSITTQLFAVVTMWRTIEWRLLPPFLAGGSFGVPLGILAVTSLPRTGFHLVLGFILMVYGVSVVLRRPLALPATGWRADAAVGFLGGITGGLAAFPGGPVTIWCGMKNWDKTRQRCVYQPFILSMQILSLMTLTLLSAPRASASVTTLKGIITALPFIPVVLLGSWAGLQLFGRISDRRFEQATACLLALAGFLMIV